MIDQKIVDEYKSLPDGSPEKEWLERVLEMSLALRQQITLRKCYTEERSNITCQKQDNHHKMQK